MSTCLDRPAGLALTPDGMYLLVADAGNGRIAVVDPLGAWVRDLAGPPGTLVLPQAVAVAADGTVVVGDFSVGMVTVFPSAADDRVQAAWPPHNKPFRDLALVDGDPQHGTLVALLEYHQERVALVRLHDRALVRYIGAGVLHHPVAVRAVPPQLPCVPAGGRALAVLETGVGTSRVHIMSDHGESLWVVPLSARLARGGEFGLVVNAFTCEALVLLARNQKILAVSLCVPEHTRKFPVRGNGADTPVIDAGEDAAAASTEMETGGDPVAATLADVLMQPGAGVVTPAGTLWTSDADRNCLTRYA